MGMEKAPSTNIQTPENNQTPTCKIPSWGKGGLPNPKAGSDQ
jgi:hypothetical protein